MFYFSRGMYGHWTTYPVRGLYPSVDTADINTVPTPFVKITGSSPNKFVNDNGECYILFGIKVGRSNVIDELILNYFKLFSVQKG